MALTHIKLWPALQPQARDLPEDFLLWPHNAIGDTTSDLAPVHSFETLHRGQYRWAGWGSTDAADSGLAHGRKDL